MVWVVVGAMDACRKSGEGKLIGFDRLGMRGEEEGEIQGDT